MTTTRSYVLGAVLAGVALLVAAVLFDVLGTAFFAVTVAYLLVPVHRRLVERGVSSWWASTATTVGATLAVLLPLAAGLALLSLRLDAVLAFLRELPRSVTVDLLGLSYTVDASTVLAVVQRNLADAAVVVARELPVVALKLSVFGFVVFALLGSRQEAARALLAPVPPAYHDVLEAFNRRVRNTLFAIYVLQAATAVATAAIAYVVFELLGYPFAGTLAAVAGLLQFLPVVGPSVLVVALGVGRLAVGDAVAAALVLVVGLVAVAWLPDVLVRPRLARETAGLPGSLYFVGFVGGLLTVGPVGVVAGPLAVAVLVEAMELLAHEVNHVDAVSAVDWPVEEAEGEGTGEETGEQ